MKHIKLYEQFIHESEMFSVHDKSEGDTVDIEGQSVTITSFVSWTKDKKANCVSFEGRLDRDNSPVTVKYVKDQYVITTEVPGGKPFTGRVPNSGDYAHY
jgi:hypothetical protein